jgi:hypothetical protein
MTAGGGFALGLLLGIAAGAVVTGVAMASSAGSADDDQLLAQATRMYRGDYRTRGMGPEQRLNVIHGFLGARLFRRWQESQSYSRSPHATHR